MTTTPSSTPAVPTAPEAPKASKPRNSVLSAIANCAAITAVAMTAILADDCNESSSSAPEVSEQEARINNSTVAEGSGTIAQDGGEGSGHRGLFAGTQGPISNITVGSQNSRNSAEGSATVDSDQ